jgi:hypothetical protein
MPVGGGPEERIGDVLPRQDWQLVTGAIYYLRSADEVLSVNRLDLQSRRVTQVLKLPSGTVGNISNFAVSPDGRWLVFVHVDQIISELMMIENFR